MRIETPRKISSPVQRVGASHLGSGSPRNKDIEIQYMTAYSQVRYRTANICGETTGIEWF